MISIVVLLFLVGGGIGAFMMLSKGSIGTDLQFVPDESDIVFSTDVGAIVSSGAGQKVKSRYAEAFNALTQQIQQGGNAKLEDIGRITFGVSAQRQKGAGIIHFNKPIDDQEFSRLPGATKRTVGGHEVILTNGMAFCRLDSRAIVVGDEASLQKVLERNGPAKLSDDLDSSIGEINFSNSFAAALSIKQLAKGGGPVGANLGAMPFGPDAIRGMAFQASIDDDIRLKAALLCKDAATADQMKKMADAGLAMSKANAAKMPHNAAKIFDTLDVSNSGAAVRASVTLDVDTILAAAEPLVRMSMLRAGGGPQMNMPPPNFPTPPTANPPATRFDPPPPRSLPPANQLNRGNAAAKMGAAAGREQASNNLRQIALAIQQYLDAKGRFPTAAIADSQGKSLLSWRVAILPYLGANEQNLYKQFHLDEPWDSPTNKRLLIRMPNVYRSPRGKNLGFGKTAMLVPLGEREAFYGRQQRKLTDFTDGTSNTILVVEAAPDRAVEWTKPDDLPFDEGDPAAGLFGQRDGGFLAAFADGAVKFIPQSIDKNILRALFTINGGETIPPDFDVKP